MRDVVKVQRIGDELGIVLPPETVERFGLKEGDELYPVKQDDGILLTRDRKLADVMGAYGEVTARYPNTLRALADS
jgi:putative addiction module antidote